MRLALVANPRSGTAPDPGRLAALLRADGAQVSVTAIADLARDGNAVLDAAGMAADGSIGVTALLAAEMSVPLAVGTANDFVRAQDLPLKLQAACALARAPRATTRRAELALAGERPFVNTAAAGLSVQAARAARPYKARLGPLAYTVGALRAAVTAWPVGNNGTSGLSTSVHLGG